MNPEDREKIIADGEMFQDLERHPGWQRLVGQINSRRKSIDVEGRGKPVVDTAFASFREGRIAELDWVLRYVEDRVNKMREVTKA